MRLASLQSWEASSATTVATSAFLVRRPLRPPSHDYFGFETFPRNPRRPTQPVLPSLPQAEEKYLVANSFVLPVQVNGKTRATLELPVGIDQAAAMARALQEEAVAKYTDGKEIKKTIYVPGKILNLVVGK